MGLLILQSLTATFAAIGVFEVIWQVILLCTRRSVRCHKTRVLIYADETTDPVLLTEHWSLIADYLTGGDTEVWLLCDAEASDGAPWRAAAEAAGVYVMTPEEAAEWIPESGYGDGREEKES